MSQVKTLVLYDFDGTLTAKDTLFDCAEFHAGLWRYISKLILLSPYLLLTKIGIVTDWEGKQHFLKSFYAGISEKAFNEMCEEYCQTQLKRILRTEGLASIREYQNLGARIFIVSASPENWIKPWAKRWNIEVLGTRLEISEGKLTGRILGENCKGQEKVNRIAEAVDLNEFERIIAYGDSSGDKEMLAIAHKKFYKPFR